MLDPSQIQEIQRIKNIIAGIFLANIGETQVDARQRPGYMAAIAIKSLGVSPATGFSSLSTGRHLVYTLNIPGIYLVYSSRHSLI
jgi:hypothetical protein